jgi:hypothetical protein
MRLPASDLEKLLGSNAASPPPVAFFVAFGSATVATGAVSVCSVVDFIFSP